MISPCVLSFPKPALLLMRKDEGLRTTRQCRIRRLIATGMTDGTLHDLHALEALGLPVEQRRLSAPGRPWVVEYCAAAEGWGNRPFVLQRGLEVGRGREAALDGAPGPVQPLHPAKSMTR